MLGRLYEQTETTAVGSQRSLKQTGVGESIAVMQLSRLYLLHLEYSDNFK